MWILWLIAGIIFAVAEMIYSGFFLIWFAIGSFMALISSFFVHNVIIESIIFLAVSLLLLLTLTKRMTQKFTSKDTLTTNIDRLIGQIGIVTESIGPNGLESGLVKLDGEIWSAVSQEKTVIEKGAFVEVLLVQGVRLIVKIKD